MPSETFDWLKIARYVLLSRELDRLEVNKLAPQGKVKYQFSAEGHELAQVLLALCLDHPHDAAAVYYRSRPFMLASGLSAAEALAAGMARMKGPSQGRDVGVVFNMPRRSGATVLPASGDVGAQYTPAAGWAQAVIYRQDVLGERDWQGAMAAACGGEGSTAANGFWAALNMSTTLKLPMLFFIEDNGFGISVAGGLQTPGGNIAANLSAFTGLKVLEARGWEPQEASSRIQEAVAVIRRGEGPCLLRVQVARLTGHTFSDNQAYKSPQVRQVEAERDPLEHLKEFLSGRRGAARVWGELVDNVKAEVDVALAEAGISQEPASHEVKRYVYFEGEAPLQGGLRPEGLVTPQGPAVPAPSGPRINFVDAVRRTLVGEMERNPHILVFGEDVGVKGGVHGATLDMQSRFGENRVFDTSLSEEGIIGRATGLALAGMLPVPEIQFRKYADPAFEQIDDLGTLRWRTANHFAAPVVVRMPVGFGKKTGDPWHSVTGEAVYAHLIGWHIAFPSNAEDAVGLLRTALRGDDPTFFFEHRALLDSPEGRRPYPGDEYCLPFGRAAVLKEGKELTIVTWGAMVPRCLKAAISFNSLVEVIDLRTIRPWDQETVLQSVRTSGKALVVHEDSLTAGFAAEILATIASEAFTDLDAPLQRLAVPDIPIPFSVNAMDGILPGVESIKEKIKELLEF
jgi:2-oxoisovalerate dehydrogenase E1 component